jgi:hypothetical protein
MKKIRIWRGNIKGQGKPMCGGESFNLIFFIRFIPLFFYSLSFYYSFILLFFHFIILCCDFRKIGVCEMGKEGCTCVKKKYNGF